MAGDVGHRPWVVDQYSQKMRCSSLLSWVLVIATIARIRAGEGYPGMRTAIAEDGTWIYFVLGQDGEE